LQDLKAYKPSIIRANATECIGLAGLWGLDGGISAATPTPHGVDSVDEVDAARNAAVALAQYTGGAVTVSGVKDLVTDGKVIVRSSGGSHFMERITGAGCSLGGVCAVSACVTDPFTAALTATQIYNLAGQRAGTAVDKQQSGPGSFQVKFLDELYLASAEDVAANQFEIQEVE
jgi:hydroxyethylthiazole kinase